MRTAPTNYCPVVPWSPFNVMSFVEPAHDAYRPGIHSYFRGSRGTGRSRSRRGNVVAHRSLITNYCCSLRRRFELEPSGRLYLNETRSHCRVASISFFKYHSGSTVLCFLYPSSNAKWVHNEMQKSTKEVKVELDGGSSGEKTGALACTKGFRVMHCKVNTLTLIAKSCSCIVTVVLEWWRLSTELLRWELIGNYRKI